MELLFFTLLCPKLREEALTFYTIHKTHGFSLENIIRGWNAAKPKVGLCAARSARKTNKNRF